MKYSEIREIRKIKSYTFYEEYETNYGYGLMLKYRNGNKYINLREGVRLYIGSNYIEISIY